MFRLVSRLSRVCLVFLFVVLPVHFATPARAATTNVACGATALSNAISAATSGDTLNLAASCTYTLSTTLSITKNLTIIGNGAGGTIIDGNNSVEVFNIGGGVTVSLSGMTIQNGHTSALGGGIFNVGTLTVSNSTFSGNSADDGGAIFNLATLTVTNSTFSGNSSPNNGGIFNAGKLTVTNSTLSGNSGDSGGIFTYEATTIVNNSIIANSTGADCLRVSSSFNASHSLIEDSTNACGVANGVNGNIVGADPMLGSLADNGGPTQTMLPAAGSPVIDAGANALAVDANANPLTTDQRGYPRISGGTVDMGAVEVQIPVTAIPALSWQALAALAMLLGVSGALLATKARSV